jgi:sugar phosphate isomerase/epimerase
VSNPTSSEYSLGYCTNVHAGTDVPTIRDNLQEHAVTARKCLGEDQLGVGLWLPNQASGELMNGSAAEDFRQFLDASGLRAFTINGFPYDNFHQKVVKHRVYLPPWWDRRRLDYTERLANILAVLLPESEPVGSISTLPIGWAHNPQDAELSAGDQQRLLARAGEYLRQIAAILADVRARTGRRIVLAIEPEPGCILDTSADLVAWFDQHLPEQQHREFITVCHDVCHAAVMMETQADVLTRFARAGIAVGKVQVSSAVVADWSAMDPAGQQEAFTQLAEFAEDRYLHQTGRLTAAGEFQLTEDLHQLVAAGENAEGDQKWVVHFHVPVFLERFGRLTTSHDDVLECLRTLSALRTSESTKLNFTGHLEVETYAWTVLPAAMRKRSLAEDIAGEMAWLARSIESIL